MEISRGYFLNQVSSCMSVISDRAYNPVFSKVHFYGDRVYGTNGSSMISAPLELGLPDTPFSIDGKNFIGLIKKMPLDTLEVSLNGAMLFLKSGSVLSKIVTMASPIKEYIEMFSKGGDQNYSTLPDTFISDLKYVVTLTNSEDSGSSMHNVHCCQNYIEGMSHSRWCRRIYSSVYFMDSFMIPPEVVSSILSLEPTAFYLNGKKLGFLNRNTDIKLFYLKGLNEEAYPIKASLDKFVQPLSMPIYLPDNIVEIAKRALYMAQTDKHLEPAMWLQLDGYKCNIYVKGVDNFGVLYESLTTSFENPSCVFGLPLRDFIRMYKNDCKITMTEDFVRMHFDNRDEITQNGVGFVQLLMMMNKENRKDDVQFEEVTD